MLTDDKELSPANIQLLSSADEVASFFLSLGYNVDARIEQTPTSLGISAESLVRQIKRVERIANQEDELQVYLFEMKSMRLADRRGLAHTFRNVAGNFLLVLTSDYDSLDFVLLERIVPDGSAGAMGRKQVQVRPRVLTVNRNDPSSVALRVLRRFTNTEPDPYDQFDKLLSAYTVAEWSEALFNNRALFSDYYLNKRLPDSQEWKEEPRPIYQALREPMLDVRARFSNADESITRAELLEPILNTLGFAWRFGKESTSSSDTPDYYLYHPEAGETDPPLAYCLAYTWNRYLDGRDEIRDKDTPDENPGAVVVSLLEKGEAPYVVVTNGKLWRLYAAKAHSRATNYYEIDLEEALASPDRARAIRYFWLFFRMAAFVPVEQVREGETRWLSFLDRMIEDSETYAKELGERLKECVFEHIFPHFARGFIEHIQQTGGKDADLSQERLDAVYHGTLTFLYRLMFLLYAEARDLLPVKEERGYWEASLARLKEHIAELAGSIDDEVEEKLTKAYRTDSYDLYEWLTELFQVIDHGAPDLNVPHYNGGLFLTDPAEDSTSPEAVNARFLRDHAIPDRHLALGLNLLARDLDIKTHDLVPIDFKSLGVRHLGSIYEGLLEFRLRIAPEKMAIVRGKRTEEVVPYRKAPKSKILKAGRGRNARERTLPRGAVYLENTRQERKATGSYYTPDYIVKYIVEHTVGPVLEEKFKALTPRLREAEKSYWQHRKNAEAKSKLGEYEDPEKFWNRDDMLRLAYDVLDTKALDPAMGSGHFLVEAVDFITDRALDFLNGFPHNPVRASLRRTREAILDAVEEQHVSIDPGRLNDVALLKRQVLKRCVYGVDLNPMAVELAKVSLWLDAFTLGAPLSFLDHHLRCGNSLIGATAREADADLSNMGGAPGQMTFLEGPFRGLLRAAEVMRGVSMLADATIEQAEQSADLFAGFERAALPYKQLLDIYVMRAFGVKLADEFLRLYGAEAMSKRPEDLGKDYKPVLEQRRDMFQRYHFFHWDMEFPEVFIDLERANWKADPGFDAVVGNPPYGHIGDSTSFDFTKVAYIASSGRADIYSLFYEKSLKIVNDSGLVSFITPNTWFARDLEKEYRRYLLSTHSVISLQEYAKGVFEDAPDVVPVVTVISPTRPSEDHMTHVRALVDRDLSEWLLSRAWTIDGSVLQRRWLETELYSINPTITERHFSLVDKIQAVSLSMGDLVDTSPVIVVYGYRGDADKYDYIRDYQENDKWKPLLRAKDLSRYELSETGEYVLYGDWLFRPRQEKYFNQKKLMWQHVRKLSMPQRLVATLDPDGIYYPR